MHRYGKGGWFGQSHRHYLAAKGIKTASPMFSNEKFLREQKLAERMLDEEEHEKLTPKKVAKIKEEVKVAPISVLGESLQEKFERKKAAEQSVKKETWHFPQVKFKFIDESPEEPLKVKIPFPSKEELMEKRTRIAAELSKRAENLTPAEEKAFAGFEKADYATRMKIMKESAIAKRKLSETKEELGEKAKVLKEELREKADEQLAYHRANQLKKEADELAEERKRLQFLGREAAGTPNDSLRAMRLRDVEQEGAELERREQKHALKELDVRKYAGLSGESEDEALAAAHSAFLEKRAEMFR